MKTILGLTSKNNTPYSSRTDCLIDEEDNAYQYKLVKVKKIKRLGK